MDSIIPELKTQANKAIEYVRQELRQIRTGQASPSLVEDLEVSAYGGQAQMKLKELATIGTDGPTTIVIDPFDASVVQDIEKAIHTSPLNLSPSVDGKIIRISTPPLTEEQREKFVKLAGQKIEEAKVQVRRARDDARKSVKMLFEGKEITEDDKYRIEKDIDAETKTLTEILDDVKEKKTNEIMTV